ncbi:MAG: sporulation protein YunB [Clostridiales bacterium]|jgi:sporulation protein YunB|nr:sporulation protein YunB [Clostridiales bacterium]
MGKNKKLRKFKSIIICCVFTFLLGAYYFKVAAPAVTAAAESKIAAAVSAAVNGAAYEVLSKTDIGGVSEIVYGADGEASLIKTDAVLINRAAREIVKKTEENLSAGVASVALNAGIFSGLPSLFGVGPAVAFKADYGGGAGCEYKTVFTGAGINQTLYKIYLTLNASADLILPLRRTSISVKCDVLLAESVIIGRVPDSYLNDGGSVNGIINLIP